LRLEAGARILRLENGTRLEGEAGRLDFRKVQFAVNEIKVPEPSESKATNKLNALSTLALWQRNDAEAWSELQWRLALPLFTLILALLSIPLSRSEPRQPQYGLILFALMAYLFGMLALLAGTSLLARGVMPAFLGLWWALLPMALLSLWLYRRDGQIRLLKPVPA
jgi:lipopolysaccharide export system permease protein